MKPSHILVNTEENKALDIKNLKGIASVYETFPKSIDDVPLMIEGIGRFLSIPSRAQEISLRIKKLIHRIELIHKNKKNSKKKCLYFIWKDPWMLASQDTYINSLLKLLGFYNLINTKERYPSLSLEKIYEYQADIILLSSEPFPFRKRDIASFGDQWPLSPKFFKIDGRLMSWYGSSTEKALIEIDHFLNNRPTHLLSLFPQ